MDALVLMIDQNARALWIYLFQTWTGYQLAIIVLLFLAARRLAKIVEPPLENWVRTINANADVLRMLAALLRRLEWVFFIPMAAIARFAIKQTTWPSRSYIIGIALSLAVAWLVIAVASRIIRNRSLARTVALIGWSIAALNITNMLDTTTLALDSLAFQLGDFRLSLLSFLQGIILIIGALWLATFIGNFAESRLQKVEDLTPSLQVLLGKIIKISLIVLALALALSGIGIDLTALTIFSGAVGVGIGFGLQKVVSNFISGVIILLDKSIKPGDTITLGDTFGWIRELRARFVSVITRDGREYLIPNEDFITEKVVNWSFSDDLVRIDVPFGVSYDSDPHQVIQLAIDTVSQIERVSDRKPTVCWMTEFGDSSINFILRFWIRDPRNGLTNIRGTVLLALWDTFKEHNITIPFPQREIIMRAPVEISMPDKKSNKPRQKKPPIKTVK